MKKPLPKIQENIDELEHTLKTEKNKHKRDRIHTLYLIKSKQAKTRIQIAKIKPTKLTKSKTYSIKSTRYSLFFFIYKLLP